MTQSNKMRLHSSSSLLELNFSNGFNEMLSLEMLRVHSPAVKSLAGKPLLVTNKAFIRLELIEEITDNGLRLLFNDGHDSGVFEWQDLYYLAKNQDQLWLQYLNRLAKANRIKQQALTLEII